MFTIKYNRSSYHIDGIPTRTKGAGQDTGTGAVPYYAESTCGALTRGRFCDGPTGDDLADILAKATLSARVNNMKMCANCVKAATQAIAAAEEASQQEEAPVENPTVVETARERGRAAGHNAAVTRLQDPARTNRITQTELLRTARAEAAELYPGADRKFEGEGYTFGYFEGHSDAITRAENGLTVVGYNDQLVEHRFPCNQYNRPNGSMAACSQPWVCSRTD